MTKIRELNIEQFRNHADTQLHLDKVNVFVGEKGAGKSSLQAAIEMILTGKCRWTEDSGQGKEALIRHHEEMASLGMFIEQIGYVKLNIPGGFLVEGWEGTPTAQFKELYKRLKSTKRTMSAALNSTYFVDMKPADQKNMVFAIAGLEFNKERILAELTKWQNKGAEGTLPEAMLQLFERLTAVKNMTGGAEVFDNIHKALTTYRTQANKKLKELEALAKNRVWPIPPEGVDPQVDKYETKAEMEKQLVGLKQEKETLLGEQGEAKVLRENYENALKLLQPNKNRLQTLENEKATYTTNPERVAELETLIPEKEKAYKEGQTQIDDYETQVRKLTPEVNGYKVAIQTLKEATGACPLAPEHVKCPMGEKEKETAITAIQKKLDKSQKDLDKVTKAQMKMAEETQTPLKEEIRKLKEELEGLKKAAEKVAKLDPEIEQLKISIENQTKLTANPPESNEELEKKLAELNGRITKGEEMLKAMGEYIEACIKWDTDEKALKDQKAENQTLERLIEAFSPAGIKQTLLKAIVEPLQERADQRMTEMTNGEYRVVFDMTNDFEIKVIRKQPKEVSPNVWEDWETVTPMYLLSDGEKLLIGVALQDVFNSITGLGIMIIDNANHLDDAAKSALLEMLVDLEGYGTIIVFSTKGENDPYDPGYPGLKVWTIDKGNVKPAPPAPAQPE